MKPTLSDLESLARQAGEILVENYGEQFQVDRKGVIDLVTEVDHRSERFLIDEIQRRYPGHRVVAEESGVVEGADGHVWYIDPLDGTVNYAHGVSIFAVSLAYVEDGNLTLGVIFNPVMGELFRAERNQGAWLNGIPLRVTDVGDLTQSLLATGFPYDIWTNSENNLDHFGTFSRRTQGVRRLGSAAIDLCYVAAGRFDGYWEIRLNAWDVAAGALIVQEAGGRVTNINGGLDVLSQPQSIIAAGPKLHAEMLAVLNEG